MNYPINVIGLGAGGLDQIPFGVYRMIQSSKRIIARTAAHPVIDELRDEGIEVESFDAVYEQLSHEFEQVYAHIVDTLIKKASNGPVIYAVPGHPNVAEKTVQLLLASEVNVRLVGGHSFIDDVCMSLRIDPVEGFQLLDAFNLSSDYIQTNQHVIIMQVFDALIASDVKLTLMDIYPWDHIVYSVDEAGGRAERVQKMPLYELDHFEGVHNLRTVYIPPLKKDDQVNTFYLLTTYIDEIVSETGDAWITDQTHQSLIPYLKEETAELVSAIEAEETDQIVEELGDVLMQVMYHARLAELSGDFQLEDILSVLNRKLRRRHPHVFDGIVTETPEEVEQLWQMIKKQEKEGNTGETR